MTIRITARRHHTRQTINVELTTTRETDPVSLTTNPPTGVVEVGRLGPDRVLKHELADPGRNIRFVTVTEAGADGQIGEIATAYLE